MYVSLRNGSRGSWASTTLKAILDGSQEGVSQRSAARSASSRPGGYSSIHASSTCMHCSGRLCSLMAANTVAPSYTNYRIASEPPYSQHTAPCLHGSHRLRRLRNIRPIICPAPLHCKTPMCTLHPDRHVQENTSCMIIQKTYLPTSRMARCDLQLPSNRKMLKHPTANYCCHCDQPELRCDRK